MFLMPILITLSLAGIVYLTHLQRLGIARRELCLSFDECTSDGSLVNAAAKYHENPRSYLRVIEQLILNTHVPQALSRAFSKNMSSGMSTAEALVKTVSRHIEKHPEDAVYLYSHKAAQ